MRPPLVFLALGAALAAAPAAAQLEPATQTGSRILVKPSVVDPDRAAVIRAGFARCMYQSNPRSAATLLENSDPLRVDLQRAGIKDVGREFQMERCLGDQASLHQAELGLRMPPTTARLMFAEQAYLAARPTSPALPAGAVEKVDRPYVSEGDALPRAQALGEFADCLVFQNVAGADALLRTEPGGAAERAAAHALAPALSACLVQGQEIKLNVRSVRQYAADGLWNRFARSAQR